MVELAQEGIDYYWDGPYMVFTATFHLKRGYCCGSGCRHCPWRQTPARDEQAPPPNDHQRDNE